MDLSYQSTLCSMICYKIFELSNKGATLASPRECYI